MLLSPTLGFAIVCFISIGRKRMIDHGKWLSLGSLCYFLLMRRKKITKSHNGISILVWFRALSGSVHVNTFYKVHDTANFSISFLFSCFLVMSFFQVDGFFIFCLSLGRICKWTRFSGYSKCFLSASFGYSSLTIFFDACLDKHLLSVQYTEFYLYLEIFVFVQLL